MLIAAYKKACVARTIKRRCLRRNLEPFQCKLPSKKARSQKSVKCCGDIRINLFDAIFPAAASVLSIVYLNKNDWSKIARCRLTQADDFYKIG